MSGETFDDKITNIYASSAEINKINPVIVDNVKDDFTKSISKKDFESDNIIFTYDELIANSAKNFKPEIFYKNDSEFLNRFLKISDTRHFLHLNYLSKKHDHNIMKLRFTCKPFSFLFLIPGESNYHIIWETLNTEEATYIWHRPKDKKLLKETFNKIEEIVNEIKIEGKIRYINSKDENFTRVYHDYKEKENGFYKWKEEVENVIG